MLIINSSVTPDGMCIYQHGDPHCTEQGARGENEVSLSNINERFVEHVTSGLSL